MEDNRYIHICLKEIQEGKGIRDAVKTVSRLYDTGKKNTNKAEDVKAYRKMMEEACDFFNFLVYFVEEVLRNDHIVLDLYHESQKDPALSIIKDAADAKIKKQYRKSMKHISGKITDEKIRKLNTLTDNLNILRRQAGRMIILMETEDGKYYQIFGHMGNRDMLKTMLIDAMANDAALIIVAGDDVTGKIVLGFSCEDFDIIPQKLSRRSLPLILAMYGKELKDNGMDDIKMIPTDSSWLLIPR